jgi:hypothetical protein
MSAVVLSPHRTAMWLVWRLAPHGGNSPGPAHDTEARKPERTTREKPGDRGGSLPPPQRTAPGDIVQAPVLWPACYLFVILKG